MKTLPLTVKNKNQHKNRQSFHQIDIKMKFLYFETHPKDKKKDIYFRFVFHKSTALMFAYKNSSFPLFVLRQSVNQCGLLNNDFSIGINFIFGMQHLTLLYLYNISISTLPGYTSWIWIFLYTLIIRWTSYIFVRTILQQLLVL